MSSRPPFLKTFPLGAGPRRLGRSPAMKKWLKERVICDSIDLLHNHSIWMMPNVYPGQIAGRFGVPLIISPRGTLSEWAMANGSSFKGWFWRLFQRSALEAASCFHATARSEYEDIRRHGFRQPVAIIPNGVDIPTLKVKHQTERRSLLFLSRIHEKKGLDMLLPAWKRVQDLFPDWELVIAGPDNGGYLPKMKKLAGDLRLQRVRFIGPVYGEEKTAAYQQADLFVLPTYSENFGMSVAEALAAGTPAIVTRGAPWEGLESNNAGWWIDIGIDPLVDALKASMSQPPEVLYGMGEQGKKWMDREYSWPSIGERMTKTYDWLLNGGDRPDWVVED